MPPPMVMVASVGSDEQRHSTGSISTKMMKCELSDGTGCFLRVDERGVLAVASQVPALG